MNKVTAEPAHAAPKFEWLALGALAPSDTHIQQMRRKRFDKNALDELASSIRKAGVLQPILVRKLDAMRGTATHEIVAGERRWLASRIAEIDQIPASVRDMADDDVIELQLIENLQREGLHELEEAQGYEELMKLKKISADMVADMVGRSRSYVFKRTKLLALCPEARKSFLANDIDASKALLIARIGHHDTQRAALKDVTEGEANSWNGQRSGEPMSFREAQQHIVETYMLALKSAPFDINDASLVAKAGNCQACPKRTGNQKDMFGDVKSGDVCTDPKCFDDKRLAHFAVARKKLEAAGKKVIYGDAAKKALPHWQNGNEILHGGYVAMTDHTYASGRHQRVSDIVGGDYEPILIQHPGTGKIIQVATQLAIAKASQSGKSKKGKAVAAKLPPKGPDIDEQLLERLVRLMYEKAPKEFSKTHMHTLAQRVFDMAHPRGDELRVLATRLGWPAGAFKSGYESKLPAQVGKLDVRGLTMLMISFAFFHARYDRKPVLALFDINEAKVREQILIERKKAAAGARAVAAKKKAKNG